MSDLQIYEEKVLRLLFVEDNHADFRLLERHLGRSDLACVISRAKTAAEALEVLQENETDIVLLDYVLPDATGLTLFSQMVDEGVDLPVIFLTASGNEQTAVEAFKLGAQDYLVKDINREYLNLLPFVLRKVYKQWEDSRERQRSEEELRETNQKLSQAMQAKDQFLANMSHELRTPLTAILGKSEVLQEGIYGPLTEEQVRAVEIIAFSGSHLLSLINDILDVARIGAGKFEINWETVALHNVCETAVQLILEEARRKRINIHKKLDDRLQTIQGDNKRITQIIVNLLSNAVKFTPDGGDIGLEINADLTDNSVNIVVWDTGIGMSEEGLRKLFGTLNQPKPFVQLENTLARQYQGSGLGLTMVYSLTRMHNGNIHIESEVDEGTRVTVSLPTMNNTSPPLKEDKSAEIKKAPLVLEESPSRSGKVLFAEDNYYTIEALVDYLKKIGLEVEVTNDGERVVERAFEMRPDLIFMDIQLPKRDGLEAIRMIRSNKALDKVPIVALTALTMPGDRERCLEAGADEFISKPFELHQISQFLRKIGLPGKRPATITPTAS